MCCVPTRYSESLKSCRTLDRKRQLNFFTTLTSWAYSVSAVTSHKCACVCVCVRVYVLVCCVCTCVGVPFLNGCPAAEQDHVSATTGLQLMNCEMLIEQLMDQTQSCMDAIKRQMATIRGGYLSTCALCCVCVCSRLTCQPSIPPPPQSTVCRVLRRARGPSKDSLVSSVISVSGLPVPPPSQPSPPVCFLPTTLRMGMTRLRVLPPPNTVGHPPLKGWQGDSCLRRT